MALYRVIYSSRPLGFDPIRLNGILIDTRRRNEQNNITGALFARRDVFIQLLEGPQALVEETLERVSNDYRHLQMKIHVARLVPDRMFGAWSMLYETGERWIWSPSEIANGALERATDAELESFFAELSRFHAEV